MIPEDARAFYNPPGTTLTKSDFSFNSRQNLFKIGRSTKATWGKYNLIQTISLSGWRNGPGEDRKIHYEDHSVVPWPAFGQAFAKPGDSGAFVFDEFGGVVGLLLGGDRGTETVRFTALEDVFDDIRHITGATDVRLL